MRPAVGGAQRLGVQKSVLGAAAVSLEPFRQSQVPVPLRGGLDLHGAARFRLRLRQPPPVKIELTQGVVRPHVEG